MAYHTAVHGSRVAGLRPELAKAQAQEHERKPGGRASPGTNQKLRRKNMAESQALAWARLCRKGEMNVAQAISTLVPGEGFFLGWVLVER